MVRRRASQPSATSWSALRTLDGGIFNCPAIARMPLPYVAAARPALPGTRRWSSHAVVDFLSVR